MKRRHLLAGAALAGLLGAARAQPAGKGLIGISMPTMASLRWIYDGLGMTHAMTALNYQVELKYADDVVAKQIAQIQAMVARGARLLVISAVDGGALGPVLADAGKKGVKVLAYDRLIRDTPNVDDYATFDNVAVGILQGQDIERRLKLKSGDGRHATIELFAGSADDNNSHVFYNGAMSVLKPHIESGVLVVGSGHTALAEVCTPRWSGSAARTRLDGLLRTVYAKRRLDAVLSPYDGMSIEILAALKSANYGTPEQHWPVVTGQDAELASARSIRRDEQASTVFKDTRDLVRVTTEMADDLLMGRKPRINDESTYNNGIKVVPAYLLKPVLVDASNWKAVLVDSGYYKDYQL